MNNHSYDDHPEDDPARLADVRSELAVIGSLFLEFGGNIPQVSFLSPSDFYIPQHATIFARMRELYNSEEEIDALTVCGDDATLHSICNEAYSSTHSSLAIVTHANTVLKLSQRRQIVDTISRAAQMAYSDVTVDDVVAYMEAELVKHHPVPETATQFDAWDEQVISAPEAAQKDKVERKYIVQDFIREGSLSIVYGDPGSLKSALVMDMAMCVANGVVWLQHPPFEGSEQQTFDTDGGFVLWLNYDMAHEDVEERLGAMSRHYTLERSDGSIDLGGAAFNALSFGQPSATLTNENQAREMGRYLKDRGYKMLVVDSLLDVKGKVELVEEGIGDVLRMWRFVAEEGECAVVIIAHTTKNSGTLYGSQFIKAKLDHLYKIERPDPKSPVVQIESEKQRSYGWTGKLYARWHYRHFHDSRTLETCHFFGDGAEAVKVVAVTDDNNSRIKRVLMDSPGRTFSNRKLQELLPEMTLAAVKAAAYRLEQEDDDVHSVMKGGFKFYYYGDEPISGDE